MSQLDTLPPNLEDDTPAGAMQAAAGAKFQNRVNPNEAPDPQMNQQLDEMAATVRSTPGAIFDPIKEAEEKRGIVRHRGVAMTTAQKTEIDRILQEANQEPLSPTPPSTSTPSWEATQKIPLALTAQKETIAALETDRQKLWKHKAQTPKVKAEAKTLTKKLKAARNQLRRLETSRSQQLLSKKQATDPPPAPTAPVSAPDAAPTPPKFPVMTQADRRQLPPHRQVQERLCRDGALKIWGTFLNRAGLLTRTHITPEVLSDIQARYLELVYDEDYIKGWTDRLIALRNPLVPRRMISFIGVAAGFAAWESCPDTE